ncbi:MAG TPA: type II secretion system protein GspM [Solirubrobacteraceae bacterium]|nr:type II secretion system protein GspM [Solirubrobacteraceae bacterium]
MTTRDRIMIIVVGVIAAIAGAWFLVIQPKRQEAAKLGTQVQAVESQLSTARGELASGQAARAGFRRSYVSLVRLGEAVPADDNVASLIVQLQAAANATHVDFRDLTLDSSSGGGSTTISTSAAQSATVSLPPGATVGPAGFPIEPFTFTFRGNFFHLSDFFGKIERFVVATNKRVSVSGRLMTLNAISLSAGPKGFPQITASISATTYLVPAVQGILNGATPSGPAAGSGTQTASTQSTGAASPAAAAVLTPSVR